MYLKSLEIQGFKSFPDRTVLTFDQEITAIVGPNGSGKSNISDAIRWVMGEQSTRALRGGKMEDVIFGGTRQRKQTGFAQVSLILDNSAHILPMDENEVMVTRRYYRSGESEYYINRTSCRLKDVNELFMDTGLGREGYSIIGQGRIDEILSVKSQDRREIFEEAAGISRYRHRKEESERRLERTEENLLRIHDKIAELELQIDPLREQSEKARQYLALREEQKGLEVSLWMDQLDQLQAGRAKLEEDCAQAAAQRDEAAREQENLYARTEELLARIQEGEKRTEQLRAERSLQEGQRAESDSRIAVLLSRQKNNAERISSLQLDLGDQQNRADSISSQIVRGECRLTEIAAERTTLEGALQQRRLALEALQERAEAASREMAALHSREEAESSAVHEAKSLLSALAATSQELLDRDAALRASLHETLEQLEQARTTQQQNKVLQERQTEKRREARNRMDAWTMKQQNRQRREAELSSQVNRMRVELDKLRGRIDMLADMERSYEGYSKAVRQLMNEVRRGTLTHVRGPVADLLRSPDRFTVAIETALGGAMQNIVVEREEDGKRAINWLKRRDAGRATFLPLSVIRPSFLQEHGLEEEPGFVGVACDLIEFDGEYKNLFANLLGRVVIAEDLDSAIAMADRHRHRFRIVTLDGQVLNPGGSMTGGSASRSAGILSRANELERLRVQESGLQADLTKTEGQYAEEHRQVEKLTYQCNTSAGELRMIEDKLLRMEADAQHDVRIIQELAERAEATRREVSLLDNRSGQNEEDIAQARLRIQTAEAAEEALRVERGKKQAEQEKLQEELELEKSAIAQLHSERAALDAEEEASRTSLEQLRQMQTEMIEEREGRVSRLEELDREKRALAEELEQEQSAREMLSARLAELDTQLTAMNQEKLNLEAERSRLDRRSRDIGNELLSHEREVSALEQKRASAASEENQLLDRLWENYALSHSAAQKVRFPLESAQGAARRIGALKRDISALGSVNVGAIEEFQRVNGRYTYLTQQRDDVTKSRDELLTIIGDLTREMERIFRTEFKKVQEAFSTTFVELFGGGRAALELEDPEDVLNCGIEIKAQPPGKSLKTITLLSGGEKAFVAIALYFSILKVRPTPFVVMDEIEAALDDSNVVRFARYLRTLTTHTQFIVITHRRGTMEEADILYGVTMQEQGVSRMLAMNLDELEQELDLHTDQDQTA